MLRAPVTSKAAPGHRSIPICSAGVNIAYHNHVWANDITYIPMAHGFLYLVTIIDWASKAVLSLRLSNTIDHARSPLSQIAALSVHPL